MTFYNRSGILYVRLNGKRVSTKLKDTRENRKLVTSYYRNDEFFNKFDLKQVIPKSLVDLCIEVLSEKEETVKFTSYVSYSSMFNSRIVPYLKKG